MLWGERSRERDRETMPYIPTTTPRPEYQHPDSTTRLQANMMFRCRCEHQQLSFDLTEKPLQDAWDLSTCSCWRHGIPQSFSPNGIECQSLRQFASANETAARGWATGNTKASHGWLPIFPTFYSLLLTLLPTLYPLCYQKLKISGPPSQQFLFFGSKVSKRSVD